MEIPRTTVDPPTSTATILRLEGAAVFVASLLVYRALGGPWLWFAILFLAPDLSMIGYLRGPVLGARIYNLVHSYVVPALVGAIWFFTSEPWTLRGAAIWTAHIGLDRMLGFGLKDPTGFKDTHLQRI